ncbi:MAG TPA: hypothetical protein VN030_10525 [Cellvibrio sp.]|nr:hypothetical protein [Cellvibrio sp.]
MNSHLKTDTPTIYADMNVFRYIACGDISIYEPTRFKWVYSNVHLDEIHRNGNTDALEGMKILGAVEIADVLNEKFQSIENVVLRNYLDPYLRYEQHLEAINGYEDVNDHMVEYLIRIFGADNFNELSMTPDQMHAEVERLTEEINPKARTELLNKAETVSNEMRDFINIILKDRMPIDKTRLAMGITSEMRNDIETSQSPIDAIWNLISPSLDGVTKGQFFGFEPILGVDGVKHTQHGAISSSQIVLNMLGISPDQGLAKREKIKKIMSDGQHVGMASYCNALLSADRRLCSKARAVYEYLGNITSALHFEFKKGMEVNLSVQQHET